MYDLNEVYVYSKDLNVLYVEDELSVSKETLVIFENFFASVATAFDGVEGLEKYIEYKQKNNNYFDIVITDIHMPNKNGIEMITDIKNIHKEQHIIVTSAYNEPHSLIDMIQIGVNSFILKPIKLESLMNIFYKICENIQISKQKESYLLQRSQYATMGEMIDSIAHQWLQPLNSIQLKTDFFSFLTQGNKTITNEKVEECNASVKMHVAHLVDTLQEFRSFFRPGKEIVAISYKKLVDGILVLMKDNITKHSTAIQQNIDENILVHVIPNEFKHIIINIVNNALEAFEEQKIENRKILFTTKVVDENAILNIIDNAGGMQENIRENIFKLNFTTKENGTGLGLYLSTQIIQKVGGSLNAVNYNEGSKFALVLPLHKGI